MEDSYSYSYKKREGSSSFFEPSKSLDQFAPLRTSTPFKVLCFTFLALLLGVVGLCYDRWLVIAGLGIVSLMAALWVRLASAQLKKNPLCGGGDVKWMESLLMVAYALLALSFLLIHNKGRHGGVVWKALAVIDKLHGTLLFGLVALMTGVLAKEWYDQQ